MSYYIDDIVVGLGGEGFAYERSRPQYKMINVNKKRYTIYIISWCLWCLFVVLGHVKILGGGRRIYVIFNC